MLISRKEHTYESEFCQDNMRMLGKRNQYLFDYKVGLNEDGKIQALTTEIYADGGWSLNDMFSGSMLAPIFGQGC